jgi:hypothetical protein
VFFERFHQLTNNGNGSLAASRLGFALCLVPARGDGRPKQAVEVAGGIIHAHTVYRDPLLAALSPEELKALDGLTRKLALPARDGPQNQIESKPAIEATNG